MAVGQMLVSTGRRESRKGNKRKRNKMEGDMERWDLAAMAKKLPCIRTALILDTFR